MILAENVFPDKMLLVMLMAMMICSRLCAVRYVRPFNDYFVIHFMHFYG